MGKPTVVGDREVLRASGKYRSPDLSKAVPTYSSLPGVCMSTPSTTISSTRCVRARRRRDPPMSAGQAAGRGSASGEPPHGFGRPSALSMGGNKCEGRLMSAGVLGISSYPYNLLLPLSFWRYFSQHRWTRVLCKRNLAYGLLKLIIVVILVSLVSDWF